MTHDWAVIAFVLFLGAAIAAAFDRAWVFVLIAAGLAAFLIPTAFQLSS